jgi:signal transduction histidine kinase
MTEATANNVSNILAVDDEQDILPLLAYCLKSDTIAVTTASRAMHALELLENSSFDVILTDVMMPEMDGLQFLQEIRKRCSDTPVILMSGHAQLDMALIAIKNGAFDLVHKPFDFDLLRKCVSRAIEFSKLRQMERNYQSELEATVEMRTAELRSTLKQLEDARYLAMQASQDKAKFLSTISHEMRTPMNGVVGAIDLLEDSGLTPDQHSYLSMAKVSTDKMLDLVNKMISFARGDNLQSSESVECLSIKALLDTIASELETLLANRNIAVKVLVADKLPETICCEIDTVRKIIKLLTGNAAKFTESGSITLKASLAETVDEQPTLLVSVVDTGIGIPPEMLEKIFDPFMQVDASLTKIHNGVGLGLSLARQMATHINASIWAENNHDHGSCFNLKLPIRLPMP